jgi:hypothetical protein
MDESMDPSPTQATNSSPTLTAGDAVRQQPTRRGRPEKASHSGISETEVCPKCSKRCNSKQSLHFHFTSKSQSNERPWNNGDKKLCRTLDSDVIKRLKEQTGPPKHPEDERLRNEEGSEALAISADEFRTAVRRLFAGSGVTESQGSRRRTLVAFFVECTDKLTLLMCAKQLSSTAQISLLAPYAPNDGVNDELEGWAKDTVVCQVYDLDENDEEAAEELSDYLVSVSSPDTARTRHVILYSLCIACDPSR